jgi:hypothetical protein
MPDFYFILFLKRLDADEKLQYFQLPYIPCRMVSGNEIKLCENLERFPPIGNILSVLLGILKLL